MTTVVLADDHPAVLAGLVAMVSGAPDLEVIGTATNGEEAVAAALALQPQLVVMDLSMPGCGGIAATRAILREQPGCPVLVLTSATDRDNIVQAVDAGAAGYVLKDCAPDDLLRAMRVAASGEVPLDPRIARELLRTPPPPRPCVDLTRRERDVLGLLAFGLANKQIAKRLGIRESTVKAHLGSAFVRIGVSDRTSAALWAERNLSPPLPA